jgi:hypothetical protein
MPMGGGAAEQTMQGKCVDWCGRGEEGDGAVRGGHSNECASLGILVA